MGSNDEKDEKTGVSKIRERFFERKRNWKPSPELQEIIKQKNPSEKEHPLKQPERKIARPKHHEEMDL